MNVKNFEKKEKNVGELTVEISTAEFDEAVNSAYKKNKNKISIPGFRKGKAPRKIIENMYGISVFYDDAMDILYPQAYGFGVEQEKLATVGKPTVLDVDMSDGNEVTVKYLVSLYPEVTMGEYKGLSAKKSDIQVTEQEIDDEILNTRKRNARIQTVDRASKDGDTVVIDFEGFIDGVPFEGGKGEGHNLVLGSSKFIPGFEEQIEGMAPGDEREINLVFPEDYTDEFAGKPVMFKIKVHEVMESILPEMDDEFAKDVSEFDTMDEYKNSIKEKISLTKKTEADKAFEDNVMTKVVENMECDIPEVMINEHVDGAIQNFNYNLAQQGMDVDMYLSMMNVSMDAFRENMRPSAERQLKIGLALEKIAELEKIEPSEEDMEEGYRKMAERYGVELDVAKDALNSDAIAREIKLMKASELVCNSAIEDNEEKKPAAKKTTKKTMTTKTATTKKTTKKSEEPSVESENKDVSES